MNDETYALLIGIDQYLSPAIPQLNGCVNDVNALEQLLQAKFNVPAVNITKLTNEQATYQAIKAAFRKQLSEAARAYLACHPEGPPPVIIFHFSGHGSQAIDETGTEPDGLDETLVCYDSRAPNVYDLKDWELGKLLTELTTYTDNVTVILDCCHAGGGTRAMLESGLSVRHCAPDLRPQPAQRPILARSQTRGAITGSGWLDTSSRYVLLAACRDHEFAYEYVAQEGDVVERHGALTYFLLKVLAQLGPDHQLTYRELYEQVRYQVNSLYTKQMPQCEGDRDRLVFGNLRPTSAPLLTVVDKSRGLIWVNGGIAHGLTVGSELAVYLPNQRAGAAFCPPMATLTVQQVGAVRSGCCVATGALNVPINAHVAIRYLEPGAMKRLVGVDVGDETVLQVLRTRLMQDDLKNYIKLAASLEAAELRIVDVADTLQIQDRTGHLLVAPYPLKKLGAASTSGYAYALDELAHDLAHLVRYQNALRLSNSTSDAALNGKIKLEIKQLVLDDITQKPRAVPFQPTTGGELIIPPDQPIVLELTNLSEHPLYFALFEFGCNWDVVPIYPYQRGAHEALAPQQTLSLGLSLDPTEQIALGLPIHISEIHETFKLIATVEEADFEILEQGELKTECTARRGALLASHKGAASPLNQLLALAVAAQPATRAVRRIVEPMKDEWTTTQVNLMISQTSGITSLLSGARRTPIPDYQIELTPPAGFVGQARVLTQLQSVYAADGAAPVAMPPGMAGLERLFQPLEIRSTCAVGPTGAVLEIEADDGARSLVTATTPLQIRLPSGLLGDGQLAFVLAYDGRLYYLVGRSGNEPDVLDVEWLPAAAPANATAPLCAAHPQCPVKLYFYQVTGWSEPIVGLHKARFIPTSTLTLCPPAQNEQPREVPTGQVYYRDLQMTDLKPGQHVALFVHGFNADAAWLMSNLCPRWVANAIRYDHLLTFDYATLSTAIDENGLALASQLAAVGFSRYDEIYLDVFADSIGALVTRSMVEHWGGAAFVDRCFLCGPPNQGMPLAQAKRFLPWLSTVALNQVGSWPANLLGGWAMHTMDDTGAGVEDLCPNSVFLRQLHNALPSPATPYFILVGNRGVPDDAKPIWQRLYRWLEQGTDNELACLLDEQNDMVIRVDAMQTLGNGSNQKPLPQIALVACHHFGYFYTTEAQQQLVNWLKLAQPAAVVATHRDKTMQYA